VSVAVLCNVSSGAATQYAHAVADSYLAGHLKASAPPSPRERPASPAALKTAPTTEQLAAYAGSYTSDEVEATFTIALDGDTLVLKRRPDSTFRLRATADDTFDAGFASVKFIRNATGQITELSVRGSRVFDIRFRRPPSRADDSSRAKARQGP
ncbi:MAG TPA: DUF3471 domain-containing protein, partial [Vicinamibacterales bacterium]|nr:DUF3471 domain-containing protein [Vicinamibacterales bacterium]